MYNCLAVLDTFPAISVDVNFKIFSEEHVLGTPPDDLHFRDQFSRPASPAHSKIPSRSLTDSLWHYLCALAITLIKLSWRNFFTRRKLTHLEQENLVITWRATGQCMKHKIKLRVVMITMDFVQSFLPHEDGSDKIFSWPVVYSLMWSFVALKRSLNGCVLLRKKWFAVYTWTSIFRLLHVKREPKLLKSRKMWFCSHWATDNVKNKSQWLLSRVPAGTIHETFFASSHLIPHSPCSRGPAAPCWSGNTSGLGNYRIITKNEALITNKSIVKERQCKTCFMWSSVVSCDKGRAARHPSVGMCNIYFAITSGVQDERSTLLAIKASVKEFVQKKKKRRYTLFVVNQRLRRSLSSLKSLANKALIGLSV